MLFEDFYFESFKIKFLIIKVLTKVLFSSFRLKMMYTEITSLTGFQEAIRTHTAVLFYFSHEACNVCKVLKPKVGEAMQEQFPELALFYADTKKRAEISAQNSIFAVPTILVFFDGREYLRKSRNIGLNELVESIQRPYELLFQQ